MHTLSKSDFKLACNCPKKLHYKKQGFPSALHDNEFMKMLAEGGYVVGKLAQLLYPGIEVQEDRGSRGGAGLRGKAGVGGTGGAGADQRRGERVEWHGAAPSPSTP